MIYVLYPIFWGLQIYELFFIYQHLYQKSLNFNAIRFTVPVDNFTRSKNIYRTSEGTYQAEQQNQHFFAQLSMKSVKNAQNLLS